jgi:hypothetical protein
MKTSFKIVAAVNIMIILVVLNLGFLKMSKTLVENIKPKEAITFIQQDETRKIHKEEDYIKSENNPLESGIDKEGQDVPIIPPTLLTPNENIESVDTK